MIENKTFGYRTVSTGFQNQRNIYNLDSHHPKKKSHDVVNGLVLLLTSDDDLNSKDFFS